MARIIFVGFIGTISGGIGFETNYMAEVMAVLLAIEWAVRFESSRWGSYSLEHCKMEHG